MPSKKMLLFALATVAAGFFIANTAKKNPNGIAAKLANLGA